MPKLIGKVKRVLANGENFITLLTTNNRVILSYHKRNNVTLIMRDSGMYNGEHKIPDWVVNQFVTEESCEGVAAQIKGVPTPWTLINKSEIVDNVQEQENNVVTTVDSVTASNDYVTNYVYPEINNSTTSIINEGKEIQLVRGVTWFEDNFSHFGSRVFRFVIGYSGMEKVNTTWEDRKSAFVLDLMISSATSTDVTLGRRTGFCFKAVQMAPTGPGEVIKSDAAWSNDLPTSWKKIDVNLCPYESDSKKYVQFPKIFVYYRFKPDGDRLYRPEVFIEYETNEKTDQIVTPIQDHNYGFVNSNIIQDDPLASDYGDSYEKRTNLLLQLGPKVIL